MSDSEEFGPLETAPMSSSDDVTQLRERVKVLEQNEAEFGQKRAKFKEIYLQKEKELEAARVKHEATESELNSVREELERLTGELEGIKTAVAYSESNKEDEIEAIRRQCKEEIDTLQSLLNEVRNEASTSTAMQYEQEQRKLKELCEKYEEEVRDLRGRLNQDGDGFLSSVAKQLKQMAPGSLTGSSSNLAQEHESLEDDMRKAQADAEILKSVVMPLEEEIKKLKDQLQEAQQKVKDFHGCMPSTKHATPDTQSLSEMDQSRDPEERIKELLKYLQAEKASRKDLEMYVAVLSTQKNVYEDEADKLKKDLNDVCKILEEEKRCHEDLRQTWQMANDQFLESQRLMMMDLRRMESVLTVEQQRQIGELKLKDRKREAQEKRVKDLEEMRNKQQQEQEQRKLDALRKIEQASEKLQTIENHDLSNALQTQSEGLSQGSNSSINFLSADDSQVKKSGSNDTLDTAGDTILDSLSAKDDGLRVQISPDKTLHMPHLSEAQKRAITDPTPELMARQSLMATARQQTDSRMSLEGRRMVSEKEWELLQKQLVEAREKAGKPCDMCNNYEAQLQNVQDDYKKEQVKAKSLERRLNRELQTLETKQKYITDLENSLNNSATEAENQISSLTTKIEECERYLTEVRQNNTQSQLELRDMLKSLSKDRETVQKELVKLQDDNDSLMGKHSKFAQQLQNEDINLPNNMEELQLLLLKYREEIIQAKVAKEHIEGSLKSENMFLKSQVHAEQQEKNTLEETLNQEIISLQEKLAVQESLKSELERESAVRANVEGKYKEAEHSLKSIQAKSKQLISALQQQVEEQSNARTHLESELQKQKGKVQSLQIDLDNSEAVQRDFVKLSQSLQIQLEKIRQAENEVRWQHEDDIEDCTNCKQAFSVTKRKHHCRHCGKIFCSDCISKTVVSGPNSRQFKVCDICHTILVKDAMPYFSTEPPSTPD
ncbi:rab GTPase-binding effector protein 1-like isoform X5 [Ostrea edulis]|uniref:rab GTPase-binding effector protein 1-like isoform X4 n=1 Tax=Ostrea edulis TaxID=37623 RepID=UPI002094C3E2|nr:rab GTPase-binding effector protein 1-like isoform X4 [Ostrea edulis]XP_056004512.1 rab GTPase-binding effector protein 1-like isoform X5 [Ostrea edulis]